MKISDRRFLSLVNSIITTSTIEDGKVIVNNKGCPQGSIVSPILANIFLHYVIDQWFEEIRLSHMRGNADMVRFADDMVFIFQYQSDAERFFRVLPKRLNKYGLKLHLGKSQLILSGHRAAARAHRKNKTLPTYNFLGFTCYWGRTKKGYWRLKFTSRKDRFSSKLKGLRKYLRCNLDAKDTHFIFERVLKVMRGWLNYHSISDNQKRVKGFIEKCRYLLFKWTNRRGRKRPISRTKFDGILRRIGVPKRWRTISIFPNSLNNNQFVGSRMR